MATITGNTSEKTFQIKAWFGLNENPDGDTKLKMGEAAAMRNWAITRDGNLRRRRGSQTVLDFETDADVTGMWTGWVDGTVRFLAACNDNIYDVIASREAGELVSIGTMDTDFGVTFFPFDNKVYMLNGTEYKVWDGTNSIADVATNAYRPLVTIAVPPAGGGETLEHVNKLTGARRCWISPDGTETVFHLPETGVTIDYVKDLGTGQDLETGYTADGVNGTVTFSTAPAQSTNSYEIGWTAQTDFSSQVLSMKYAELYSGTTDTRVFLYGDGSNEAFYSDVDYDGNPRADYFPDLNEVAVGEANSRITGMVRNYSSLICFKEDSTWMVQYGIITLADGSMTPAFYVIPTNKIVGNVAMGQVQTVLNAPRTLFGKDCYEWRNNASYASNLNRDERQAKRISDRVYKTIGRFPLASCLCYDDNDHQEYYIRYGKEALVHNYAVDAWYYYNNFDAVSMANLYGELYFGTSDGKIKHFSYDYLNDDGEAIDSYWESGSMDFGLNYMRKYSAQIWVGIKPDSFGEVYVTVQTDKKNTYSEKVISTHLASFWMVDFSNWTFGTDRRPKMKRLKIKAKKFVFYKLIFHSIDWNAEEPNNHTSATILAADMKVRFTGYTK